MNLVMSPLWCHHVTLTTSTLSHTYSSREGRGVEKQNKTKPLNSGSKHQTSRKQRNRYVMTINMDKETKLLLFYEHFVGLQIPCIINPEVFQLEINLLYIHILFSPSLSILLE